MPDAPVLLAGRYRLGESLGRGGMGQVLLARDETLQRDVAIKEIDQPLGADGGASARRTLREARASARINHPNVVQVYDVLQLDDRTWIVMEYVPSRSLREEIAEQGPLDPYRVARIGLELLGALRTAHRLGVEHRDVKPANVLLADDGRVLLTDFGIAAVDDDGVISRSDILVGSPQFMAPERAQGTPSGPEADLWSLGATLYAAIEGRAPYQRGSTMATLAALATEEPDPPVHAGVLRPLLDGLLRKDPAARMAAEDAENLARAIITGLSETEEATPKPSGLAGFAASLPVVFRIPRPRESSEGSASAGDSPVPGPEDPVSVEATPESGAESRSAAEAEADPGSDAGPGGNIGDAVPAKDDEPEDAAGSKEQPGAGVAEVPLPEVVTRATSAGVPVEATGAERRRRGLIVAVAALAVVLVVGVAWALTGRTGSPEAQPAKSAAASTAGLPAGAPPPSATPSPAASSEPAQSPSPSGESRPQLPAGWVEYKDKTGFSLYVPAGWTRSKEGSIVYFRGDGKILGIDQTDEPKSNPVKDWRTQADNRVSGGDFPQYAEVHIKAVDYFLKAADWEFTFMRDGVRRHVNNRGTVVSENRAYGIYWQTPDSEWSDSRDDLQLVFDSFVPDKNTQ
ncbi:protein kinase [Actinoplanes sp. NPDC026670]|uniref:serine/threonine-protein kinase n=1 Tax=Actinoplanes sp. NPDC026670 TaxID=3154700 RepID=UPI0034082135